jgi:hypothetical protein
LVVHQTKSTLDEDGFDAKANPKSVISQRQISGDTPMGSACNPASSYQRRSARPGR